jgi:hypothetical protein
MQGTSTQLWYFLIDGKQDDNTGVFGNFYSYGNHCGESLYRVVNIAAKNGFNSPNVIEAERVDNLEGFQLPEDIVQFDQNVLMRSTVHSFEINEEENQFIPPAGIIKASTDGEYEYELIKDSFVAYGKDENGIFEFELVAGKSRLIETFLKAITFLPTVDGFWIYIWNHWDDDKTELWAAKKLDTSESIITFLTSNQLSTLENGYIDCVVHSLSGETNLTLDDHKKIQLHTKDEKVFNEFGRKIMALGFEQTHDFYNLEFGYHHWHYRPFGSLSREQFRALLENEKFELLDSWSDRN